MARKTPKPMTECLLDTRQTPNAALWNQLRYGKMLSLWSVYQMEASKDRSITRASNRLLTGHITPHAICAQMIRLGRTTAYQALFDQC